LAEQARSHGPGAGHVCLAALAPSTVHDILNHQPIKPHSGVRYYLERRGPPEAERPVTILSYDEKPGIQAIATTAPDLPPQPGKHAGAQREYRYKRLGTVTLSASVDLVSGVVHHARSGPESQHRGARSYRR
jgi:hypothetical protein